LIQTIPVKPTGLGSCAAGSGYQRAAQRELGRLQYRLQGRQSSARCRQGQERGQAAHFLIAAGKQPIGQAAHFLGQAAHFLINIFAP
jgi:hypothetical protein